MKSTVKVSISRSAFHLDSDAYAMLEKYLDALERHFVNKEGGKEIVSDIEERLAELLAARISIPEQVVSVAMVEEIIAIMGMPDDMEDIPEFATMPPSPKRKKKRLYRNVDDNVIGGVCSGLAAYFTIEVILIRILFVLFFFGFPTVGLPFGSSFAVILYLALWAAVPAARTPKQKIEVRGEDPTISSIQRRVEDEIEAVRQKWEKQGKKWTPEMEEELYAATHGGRKHSSNLFVRFAKVVLRVLILFIGIITLIAALGGLIALPLALFRGSLVSGVVLFDVLNFIHLDTNITFFKIMLLGVLLIPLLGLIYIGVKAIVGFRDKFRIGLVLFLLWIASLTGLVIVGGSSVKSYMQWGNVEEKIVLPVKHDTLYVDMPGHYYDKKNVFFQSDENDMFSIWASELDHDVKIYMMPTIKVMRSYISDSIYIEVVKRASGRTISDAYDNAGKMPFNYTLRDSLLLIDPYVYSKNDKWSGQLVTVKIYVPKGKEIKLQTRAGYKKARKIRNIKIGPTNRD
jgi:phage shock protein PspC (stress-responsive transcriptional regulator)